VDIPQIARKTVKEIGYTRAKYGFDGDTCSVLSSIDEQSTDIALGLMSPGKSKREKIRMIFIIKLAPEIRVSFLVLHVTKPLS
jgi:S-adenosylmethionine synthetase